MFFFFPYRSSLHIKRDIHNIKTDPITERVATFQRLAKKKPKPPTPELDMFPPKPADLPRGDGGAAAVHHQVILPQPQQAKPAHAGDPARVSAAKPQELVSLLAEVKSRVLPVSGHYIEQPSRRPAFRYSAQSEHLANAIDKLLRGSRLLEYTSSDCF
mmetsp:Transcript_74394/g.147845  ORF Transcript_74394/g.147845 Transcript_74394/m.147845 type:complete len:158 (-) Transcript_74394:200-673(-)